MKKGIFTALIGLLVLVLISTTIISMKSSQRTEINPKPESFTHVTTQWLNTRILLDNNITADAITDDVVPDLKTGSCDGQDLSNNLTAIRLEPQLRNYYSAAINSMNNGCYFYEDPSLDFVTVEDGAIIREKYVTINFRLACDQNAVIDGKYQYQTLFDQEIKIEKMVGIYVNIPVSGDCTFAILDRQSDLNDLEISW